MAVVIQTTRWWIAFYFIPSYSWVKSTQLLLSYMKAHPHLFYCRHLHTHLTQEAITTRIRVKHPSLATCALIQSHVPNAVIVKNKYVYKSQISIHNLSIASLFQPTEITSSNLFQFSTQHSQHSTHYRWRGTSSTFLNGI